MDYLPPVAENLRKVAKAAKRSEDTLASFKSLNLNLGGPDTIEDTVLTEATMAGLRSRRRQTSRKPRARWYGASTFRPRPHNPPWPPTGLRREGRGSRSVLPGDAKPSRARAA